MITEIFLQINIALLKFVFGLFPSLPPMPTVITNALGTFLSASESAGNLLSWLYGDVLWVAIVGTFVVLMTFEQLYKFFHFIIRTIGLIMLVNKFK